LEMKYHEDKSSHRLFAEQRRNSIEQRHSKKVALLSSMFRKKEEAQSLQSSPHIAHILQFNAKKNQIKQDSFALEPGVTRDEKVVKKKREVIDKHKEFKEML